MSQITAEQFGQRLIDCNLVEPREMDVVFGEIGSRHAELEQLHQVLLRKELLTNWQMDRVMEGHVAGYFYGKYKVLYLVGAGTFARVYRAEHRETGEVKAIKVLRKRYTEDTDTRERFLQEAAMVKKLRHPNIVPIYDVAEERGRFYMVMDFIEGQNLRDFVRVHGKLELIKALEITRDLAAGLDYAFKQNLTHRDLKLSNVLLSSRGHALLVDFGLAAAAAVEDDRGTAAGGNPRSIDYAGLERATGVQRDDKRSDVFFLGCMFYHLLSGKPALYETKERIQRLSVQRFRDITPITVLDKALPHRVVVLVNRCLDLDPEKRFQTPGDMRDELDRTIAAIKAGDTQQYDEDLARKEAEAFRRRENKLHEGKSHTLMLIESHVQMQNVLRDKLKELGYRVLIFSDPGRGLLRFTSTFSDADRPADCVIFGCASLGYDALDAFNEFARHERTRDVPAILITSEKQAKMVGQAKLDAKRVHLPMPIKFKQLRRTLRSLLNISVSDPSEPKVG